MAVQTQAATAFSTASFQCQFSKISQMHVDQEACISKFVFMNECEFNLSVFMHSKTVYEISMQLFCEFGLSIHCKVNLIDRHGKEHVAEGEYWEIMDGMFTVVIKVLDTAKEDDFLSGDTLTVRCTLSVDKNRDTEDDISNTKAFPLACKELSYEDLTDFLLNDENSDVILHVQKKEFTVRKSILRSRSKVFRDMLLHNMMETCIGTVIINGCDSDSFGDYLHYLYSGKIPDISRKNVGDLYCIASKFDAQELKAACLKFMLHDLSISSICDYIDIAIARSEKALLKPAEVFFTENFKDIIQTAEWKSLILDDPTLATELLRLGLRLTPVSSKK